MTRDGLIEKAQELFDLLSELNAHQLDNPKSDLANGDLAFGSVTVAAREILREVFGSDHAHTLVEMWMETQEPLTWMMKDMGLS